MEKLTDHHQAKSIELLAVDIPDSGFELDTFFDAKCFLSHSTEPLYSRINADHIRLFTVEATEPTLRLKLETFSASDVPEYKAFSYAWEDQVPTETCLCNGQELKVSLTLFRALKCIGRHVTGHLWVDAVCISQDDDIEKAAQVSQMGKIFADSKATIIWLGDGSSQSELAFTWVSRIAACIRKVNDEKWLYQNLETEGPGGLPHLDSPIWPAFSQILARPWFRRLWIVQEVVLSPSAQFWCGENHVAWSDLATIARAMRRWKSFQQIDDICEQKLGNQHTIFSIKGQNTMHGISGLIHERKRGNHTRTATYILEMIRTQSTSEMVDRAYAVLGILPYGCDHQIAIDYSWKTRSRHWEVYAHLISILIQMRGDLRPTGCFIPTSEDFDKPSWCQAFSPHRTASRGPKPLIGAGTRSIRKFAVEPLSDFRVLKIAGTVVDTISIKIPLNPKKMLKGLKACLKKIPPHLLESRKDQLAAVLVGDQGMRKFSQFHDFNPWETLVGFREYLEKRAAESTESDATAAADRFMNSRLLESKDPVMLYRRECKRHWDGYAFAMTEKNRFALVPERSLVGDVVAVFHGASFPFVISGDMDMTHYRFRGWCCLYGIMEGELYDTEGNLKEGKDEYLLMK